MQEITLILIRLAYVVVLWLFVFGALSVIRSDLFGAKVAGASKRSQNSQQKAAQKQAQKAAGKAPRSGRNAPTQLVVIEGVNAGASASLGANPVLIGRGPEAGIRLDDDYASTRHARVGWSGETWYVEDLGSTNGTYLGTTRLTQPTAVGLGSRIRIGKTTMELKK